MRILVIALMCLPLLLRGQYITAGGVCIGNNMGLTLQQRVWPKMTVEGVLETNFRGDSRFSATLQRHHNIIFKGFNYYYGLGLHRGWEAIAYDNPDHDHAWGASGIVGIELMLGRGFVCSYHYRPGLNLSGGERFSYHQSGFSIRRVFIKEQRRGVFGGKKRGRKKRNGGNGGNLLDIFKKQ